MPMDMPARSMAKKAQEQAENATALLAEKPSYEETRLKANKLELEDVSETFLGALSGNATFNVLSKPQKNSVDFSKFTSDVLERLKLIRTVYLFNKDTAITNGYYAHDTGAFIQSTTIISSDLIPTKPNTVYTKNQTSGWAITFWDADGKFVSGVSTGGKQDFRVPNTATIKYMRVPVSLSDRTLNDFMVVEGNGLPASYVPYYVVDNSELEGIKGKVNNLEFVKSVNIFNKNKATKGYYQASNGSFMASETVYSTDFIEAKSGDVFTKNQTAGWDIVFFDINKVFIVGMSSNGNSTFTVPNNPQIAYMKMSVNTTVTPLNEYMLVKGPTLPGKYVPYGDVLSISKENTVSERELYFEARGKVNVFVETYYEGGNQPYHPSIYNFDAKWNGYKYWMAYTPLPYGDEDQENPCIAVSNDMIKWVTPNGLTNPIDNISDRTQTYWSDTEILYNPDTSKLEVWYRGYNSTTNTVTIARKTSSDGINWSAREILKTFANTAQYVSPSVIYENGKYKIWILTPNVYFQTTDPKNWGTSTNYTFPSSANWHGQVKHTDKGYEYISCGQWGSGYDIDYLISDDGINFRFVKSIIKSNFGLGLPYGIDNFGYYRPCFIKENGVYYVVCSTITKENYKGITMSISYENDITKLKGIDESFLPLMAKPTKRSMYGTEQFIFDKTDNTFNYCPNPSTTKQVAATWFKVNAT